MKEALKAIGEAYLPTTLAQTILATGVPLAVSPLFLPDLLPRIGVTKDWIPTLQQTMCMSLGVLNLVFLSLLICVVRHYRSLNSDSESWIEYRGAFFKRAPDGTIHRAVYCGTCKMPTSFEKQGTFGWEKFVCSCGWKSIFGISELKPIIAKLTTDKPGEDLPHLQPPK